MRLTAEVLGPVRLIADGTPVDLGGPRQRRLLGALLVHRGSVVSTDRLIDAVFDGEPPEAARRTFRTYVARLRRALVVAGVEPSGVLVTEAKGYSVPDSALELDSVRFEEAIIDAQDRLTAGDADGAALGLDEALGLWSGPAYGEFAEEEWASVEAIRLTAVRTVARELRAEAMLESGRHAAVIPDIEVLIEEEPFREEPRRLLMVALYRAGRHVDALRAGREYRRFLADETGLEPSRELEELEQLIVDQDPRLEARPQGRKLRGYVLGPPIAESDLGITYRATQPSVGRDVAITAIPPDLANDAAFVRRFEVHAQRIASIEHLNVVPLYDYWREPGAAYLVTRFLSGGSLDRRIRERPMTDDERLSIVRQVGAALTAAHERGIVHGQLDASSVLFDDAGMAYLTGFSLDVDPRSRPTDIAALGQLAAEIWTQSAETSDRTKASVAIASRVMTIAERAGQSQTDVPVGSVAELVAAIESATAGRTVTTAAPKPSTIEGPNPYRGLFAFAEPDAEVFFGREQLVEQLVEDLAAHPFLAVVGPSGSGKSSVVRAGLLPRLRSTGAFVATMVPGERPLAELEIALSRVASTPVPSLAEILADDAGGLGAVLRAVLPEPERELILLIDQFEEAFTASDPAERDLLMQSIFQALDDPAVPLRVVITARADFLGPILDHAIVGGQVRDHSRLVTPLDSEELHVAIVGPAETAGVAVESALAARLVSDAATAPGSLPLLQYSLTELYEHRVDGVMTVDAYQRLGGMGAVLSQRAEEIYSGLDANGRAASRRLFSRLITPGEGTDDTRRRARQSELANVSGDLLGAYGAARLIAFDRDPSTREPTVEIAHEALIREWRRLRGWIDEDRDGVRILRRLTTSTAEWEASDRDDSELYRSNRLGTLEEWAVEHEAELSKAERAFFDASRAQRDDHALVDRRRVRRLRSLLVTVAVIAVLATVAGLLAVVQSREADSNAREADVRRVMAESQVAVDDEPNRALLLALEAYRLDPSTETLGTIVTAGAGSPTAWLGDITNGKSYRRVAFLDDGLVVASNDQSIEVWDVAGRIMLRERPLGGLIADIELSADRELVAAGSSDGSWSVLTASDLEQVTGGRAESGISVIRIDAEHDVVALGLIDGRVQIESISGASPPRLLDAHDDEGEDAVSDVSLNSDGRMVAASWGSGVVARQWDLDADTSIGQPLVTELPADLVLYADEVLHVVGIEALQSFDPPSGEPIGEPRLIAGGIRNGSRLTSAGPYLQVVGAGRVVNIDEQGDIPFGTAYESGTTTSGGAISPDGGVTAFATTNGLAFWAQNDAGLFVDAIVPAGASYTQFNAISTDGRTVVQGGNIRDRVPTSIWTLAQGDPTLAMRIDPGKGVRQFDNDTITFEPGEDGLLFEHWNEVSSSFEPLIAAEFRTSGAGIPAFTPDGKQFLHPWVQGQGILDVYDVESGRRLHRLTDVGDAAPPDTSNSKPPKFSPDGQRLVYPTESEYVAVYDTATWNLLELLDPSIGFTHLAFTPDGIHAITLSSRGLELRDATDLRTVLLGPVPDVGDPGLGRGLAITTDGRYLKTSSLTGAQLWDPTTLEPIGEPFPHDLDAWAATLAAETNQLATVVDGATVIWNIDLDEWPELACLAAGRNLTREEWEKFGPRGDYHATCDRWPAG
jgi:DNA-binding SARP family transcriptional activator/WD40 repeat protein